MSRNLRINHKSLAAAILCGLCISGVFALDELGVAGPVKQAQPYYQQFILKSTSRSVEINQQALPSSEQANAYLAHIYEYDSGLKAGSFKRYYHGLDTQYAYQTPICLIANDDVSKSWLKKKALALSNLNAVCYLVRHQPGEIEQLQAEYPELRILSVNPAYIIRLASIPHYPAVLSKKGVEQ